MSSDMQKKRAQSSPVPLATGQLGTENKKQDSAPPDVGLTSSLSELADKGKDVVKDGLQGPTKINEMVYERRTMEEK